MMSTSSDGISWAGHEVTSAMNNLNFGIFDDKPYMAADPVPAHAGRAFVAWDRTATGTNGIIVAQFAVVYLAQTNDSGVDWSNPPTQYTDSATPNAVSDPNNLAGAVIFAMPVVSPDGSKVYVVWLDYQTTPVRLFINSCTPASDPLNPIPVCDFTKAHSILSLNAPILTDIGCNAGRQITSTPSIAVTPSGRLYVTFADKKPTGSNFNILLVYSDDGGTTWSGPYRLNDEGTPSKQHYFPALSVVGSLAYVSWLDRRNDPQNCLTQSFSTYTDGTKTLKALNAAPNLNDSAGFGQPKSSTANQSNYNGDTSGNGPGDYSGTVGMAIGTHTLQHPLWPVVSNTVNPPEIFTEAVEHPAP
jgi:hypothetical protein